MEEEGILNQIFENYIYFIGDKDFGTWENEKIEERTKKFVDFYLDKFGSEGFQELKAEFRVMNKEGLQKEYEIKILFVTDKGSYHTEKTGWNAYNVFRDSIEAIENQVFKNREDYK